MAYLIGTFVWLILVGFSIYMWNQPSGFLVLLGHFMVFVVGVGSTILYAIYLLLVFLSKRNMIAFWIILGITVIAILSLFLYIT
jgi:hypothetical protein